MSEPDYLPPTLGELLEAMRALDAARLRYDRARRRYIVAAILSLISASFMLFAVVRLMFHG